MLPDAVSAALRGLGFLAVLQAAGATLFLTMLHTDAPAARPRILRLKRWAALTGTGLLLAQYLLEAARMAGSFAGTLDAGLQGLVLHSRVALTLALRLAGLLLLALTLRDDGTARRITGLAGALLIAGSFAATGHTSESPLRWLLGPLLGVHVLIVAFWFGSLLPLLLVSGLEPAEAAAALIARFSRLATWTVPLILVAGIVIAARLLPDMAALRRPYGIGLSLKVLVFAVLMAFAARNKWQLGPALAQGGGQAALRLRRSLRAELVLIAAVLLGTAALTMFWSPDG